MSRPDAFAALDPKLRAGYPLDALGHLDFPAAPPDAAMSFVTKLDSRRPKVPVSAFTAGAAERSGRIARLSSRR